MATEEFEDDDLLEDEDETTENPETGHGGFSDDEDDDSDLMDATGETIYEISLSSIKPSPENDTLYKPVDTTTAEFKEMVASVKEHGILEPFVLSLDDFILSGHRRYAAARAAGIYVAPVRYRDVRRGDSQFVELLREYNRQRVKTRAELLRESIVDADPDEAHYALLLHREQSSQVEIKGFRIEGEMKRSEISDAKRPMLNAVIDIIGARRKFWPLSDRFVHYQLLNIFILRHASKPASRYINDKKSYSDLTDLLTRARLVGEVPWEAIADPTRPVVTWNVHDSPAPFFDKELDGFLKGYHRNYQQSQPNHIEILGEKNTIESIIRPIAARYGIPYTIGRGFSSLDPRHQMAERFQRSGKENLVLLIVSDFDPAGESIAQSFAKSMRDDFNIWNIIPHKVTLTREQINRYRLPSSNMEVKTKDARAKKFVEKHGPEVYELEALTPEQIQAELIKAIDSVLDIPAFNRELEEEKRDWVYMETKRKTVFSLLQDIPFD